MRWWKVLGLAGLAGVAASGVVIARGERQRRAYTPEEIRSRLHERVAAVASSHDDGGPAPTPPSAPSTTS
jgi:hypothetical protein